MRKYQIILAYLQLADQTIIPMPGVDEKSIEIISKALDSKSEGDSIPAYENGIELVSEPITLKHLAGYATDATGDIEPLYEYFTINSFQSLKTHLLGKIVRLWVSLSEENTLAVQSISKPTPTQSGIRSSE